MYETLMHTLRRFVGVGLLRWALVGAMGLIVLGLAAYASGAFRTWLERSRERGGWRAGLVATGTGLFKLLVVFVLMRGLIVAMVFQAERFEHQHGRITERNRSAVLMKWGRPHEQRELSVWHTRKRVRETRQLKLPGEKGKVVSQTYWQDERPPVQAVEGEMPTVISVHTEDVDVSVEQKSIVSADIDITVVNNPRTLGGANYAGYDDTWSMKYVVANRSSMATTAHFYFPLPAEAGNFDRMVLTVDGKDILDRAQGEDAGLAWTLPMRANSQVTVEIGYRSRGLEHLRYIPRRMSQTGHYRVAMTIHGIPPHRLDYPIGSMPPEQKLTDVSGDPYTLTWTLDNALTSYDIGVKLPVAEQPAYHIATLLNEAPVGLLLLAVVLILPRVVAGTRVSLGVIGLLSAAYYLLYTFMGRLADLMTGFAGPFLIASAVLIAIVAFFRMKDRGTGFLACQDSVWFAALAVLYPLAIVDPYRTAFWMQLFYIAILVYVGLLSIRFRVMRRNEEPIVAQTA